MAPRRVLLSFRKVCSAAVTVALVITAFWIAGKPTAAPAAKPTPSPKAAAAKPKAATAPVDMTQFYGFKKVEVFKLEPRSSNLLTGDFNNDGLTDLVLFDNSHARIDLLLQRRHPEETTTADSGRHQRQRRERRLAIRAQNHRRRQTVGLDDRRRF